MCKVRFLTSLPCNLLTLNNGGRPPTLLGCSIASALAEWRKGLGKTKLPQMKTTKKTKTTTTFFRTVTSLRRKDISVCLKERLCMDKSQTKICFLLRRFMV